MRGTPKDESYRPNDAQQHKVSRGKSTVHRLNQDTKDFIEAARRFTAKATRSRKAALRALIRAGILTEDGDVHPNYREEEPTAPIDNFASLTPGTKVICIGTERTGFLEVGQIYKVAQPIPGVHDHPQVTGLDHLSRIDMNWGSFSLAPPDDPPAASPDAVQNLRPGLLKAADHLPAKAAQVRQPGPPTVTDLVAQILEAEAEEIEEIAAS